MICTQSTSWMEYILSKGEGVSVCDLYSSCGKIESCYTITLTTIMNLKYYEFHLRGDHSSVQTTFATMHMCSKDS